MEQKTKTLQNPEIILTNLMKLLSCEMRTPLNAVVGGASLLSNTYTKKNKDCLAFIDYGVKRIIYLTDVVNVLADLKSNNFSVFPVTVDPNKFIKDLENDLLELSLSSENSSRFLTFKVNGTEELVFDKNIVSMILLNILLNINNLNQDAKFEIIFYHFNNKAVITINEISKGITKKDIPFIYNPFRFVENNNFDLMISEDRMIYQILINELVEKIDANLNFETNQSGKIIFKLTVPNGAKT